MGREAGFSYWLVQTGIGFERAGEAARAVFDAQSFGLAVSSGFACALGPARVGDLLVGTEVASYAGEGPFNTERVRPCSTPDTKVIMQTADANGMTAHEGRFLSVPRVVCRASDKRALSILTNSIALDMESAPLAEMADVQGVPLVVVRTVSDLVDEDLPLDFNVFLRSAGWGEGLLSCLKRPSSLIGVARLRAQSKVAAARLTDFFLHYIRAVVGNESPSWG